MTSGSVAERYANGLWHPICLRGYLAARTASMAGARR